LDRSKNFLKPGMDTGLKFYFGDRYSLLECASLLMTIDSKYFGWMRKDDE